MPENANPHLNMFYPYRKEVIEQNLTRALIILLKILSADAKKTILKVLVGDSFPLSNISDGKLVYSIEDATPVQNNCKLKRLVAISSTGVIADDEDTNAKSIPDAQIRLNSGNDIVIMIESKVRSNSLSRDQLKRHAALLGSDLESVLAVVTWNKISSEISKLIMNDKLSEVETFVCEEFLDFLSMYGYGILNRLSIPVFEGLEVPRMR